MEDEGTTVEGEREKEKERGWMRLYGNGSE